MKQPPKSAARRQRTFWQQLLIILGIDTVIVMLGALVFRDPDQISNFYFLSSIALFIVAAIPIATEIGGSAKIAGKAIKDGEKVNALLKEKQVIYEQKAQTTYLYGLAGLITFVLSFASTILIQ